MNLFVKINKDDIDIAIDSMMGEKFANHVKSLMESKSISMSTISKIQVNPDKSKHLETATARILGIDIDFVNLRSETCNSDSRNPQIVCII